MSNRLVFVLASAVALAYCGARSVLWSRLPVVETIEDVGKTGEAVERTRRWRVVSEMRGVRVTSAEAQAMFEALAVRREFRADWWLRREYWITPFRLAALLGYLLIAARAGGFRRWGWHLGASTIGLALVCGLSAIHLLETAGPGERIYKISLASQWLLTLPVAFAEEAGFRGLIYGAMRSTVSPRRAATLSSLFFMAWHYGAQSLMTWPFIFFFGVAACAAYELGTGLVWLALVHEALDSLQLMLQRGGGSPYDSISFLGGAGVAAASLWIIGRAREASPVPARIAA